MDKDALYFLKVSGSIQSEKHREFQQTVQFIFNHLPKECLSHNLTLDVHARNMYHLYSIWQSESSLIAFKSSHEFDLLKGAFQALGKDLEVMGGKWADVQLFELDHLDA